METLNTFNQIKKAIEEKGIYEREKELKALFIAYINEINAVLVGEPGLAKTQIIIEFTNLIGKKVFTYQLNKFTEYSELFGYFDIKKFQEGILERVIKMQDADIIYFDEIFKANSAIMNSLLSLLRERKIFDGYKEYKFENLKTILGSTNYIQKRDSENEAFIDRFIIQVKVNKISKETILKAAERQINKQNSQNNTTTEKITFNEEKIKEEINKETEQLIKSQEFKNLYNKFIDSARMYSSISDRTLITLPRIIATLKLLQPNNTIEEILYQTINDFTIIENEKIFNFLIKPEITELKTRLKEIFRKGENTQKKVEAIFEIENKIKELKETKKLNSIEKKVIENEIEPLINSFKTETKIS
ncbi:MAG: AAA family ATPase [Sulfurihydrogenibium sp.]|jgi:MoxR-like ATPase|nr:AAA family ATPase [Sulfurihydrogenibium sp.]